MAAGQQKTISTSMCTSNNGDQEHWSEKRKIKPELSKMYQRMRPHIALEWDDIQRKAVARKGQVGITWRYLLPFSAPSSLHSHMDLAHVFIVPEELYELMDLRDVLTHEVWHRCLSDSERKLLVEFLPKGLNPESVIQSLLLGNNFHFGNPFITWGSLLCAGGMHPDVVCLREIEFRAAKKAYYSELQNYHNKMLEILQQWKEAWKTCKNSERELSHKIWQGSQKHHVVNMHEISEGGDTMISNTRSQEKLHATVEDSSEKKLAEHWLLLIERDVPVAYAKFVEGHSQRHIQRKRIQKEILERQKLVLDKANCEKTLTDSKKICAREGPQNEKQSNLSPFTNLSGHVSAKIEDLGKSDSEFTQPDSQLSIQHGSSSRASKSSDTEEPYEQTFAITKSLPVLISSMCCSPILKMTSKQSVLQITKYEEHEDCVADTQNEKPVEIASPESKLEQNFVVADMQLVCKDEPLSSIKETKSTPNGDSRELCSQDALATSGKESSNFVGRKRQYFWTPSKLTEESSTDASLGKSTVRGEPEKRACYSLQIPGMLQTFASQPIQMSPYRDQAKNQSYSSLVNMDKKSGTQSSMLHLNQSLNSEDLNAEMELQPFNKGQDPFENQILCLGMDHPSHLSLQQPQQVEDKINLFKLSTEKSEEQRQFGMHPPLLSDLTKKVSLTSMQPDEVHSLFISSSKGVQPRGRPSNVNHENHQAVNDYSLPCESARGQTQQDFQHASRLTQELQLLTDIKSLEQKPQLQQRNRMQSCKQEGFNGHVQKKWIFRQNHHPKNKPYLFQHSQQNQSLQPSGQQDFFLPGLSPVAPNWDGPLQAIPMPQFEPRARHWNGSKNQFQSSWCSEFLQRSSITGHGHAGNNGEGKLFGSPPQWDGLPHSTYGILSHDQNGNLKSYTSIGCSSSNNGHGQDDWIQLKYSHTNPPYSYPHETSSTYRAGHIPCISITSTSYSTSQIAHFKHQNSGLQNINGQGPSLKSPWNL